MNNLVCFLLVYDFNVKTEFLDLHTAFTDVEVNTLVEDKVIAQDQPSPQDSPPKPSFTDAEVWFQCCYKLSFDAFHIFLYLYQFVVSLCVKGGR